MKTRSQKETLITRTLLLAMQILLPLGLYFVLDKGSSLIVWVITPLFLLSTFAMVVLR